MIYVALLRGVNVGGKSMISMESLRRTFADLGFNGVTSYINSGNIIFTTTRIRKQALTRKIEEAIENQYHFPVKVLLKTHPEMKAINDAIPSAWDDAALRCYVLFLWPAADQPTVLADIPLRQEIEEARYVPGAVLHAKKDASKSRLNRIAGTPLYQQITIRNSNTVRKLLALMEANL